MPSTPQLSTFQGAGIGDLIELLDFNTLAIKISIHNALCVRGIWKGGTLPLTDDRAVKIHATCDDITDEMLSDSPSLIRTTL